VHESQLSVFNTEGLKSLTRKLTTHLDYWLLRIY